MRTLGLDVHKTFIEVALHEAGSVRRVGRVAIKDLSVFAESLVPTDHVVLESTSVSWAIVDVLAKRAGKVTVSNPMKTRAIASAKVKTDKVDARVLAQLGAADFVAEVWVPDAETRALRRRVAHRAGLVRQRTGLRNQVHGVLARNLAQLPHMSDLFGRRGRRALEEVVLPAHEREQIDSALRLHDALQGEVDRLDVELARCALVRDEVRRLLTIPGMGAVTARPGNSLSKKKSTPGVDVLCHERFVFGLRGLSELSVVVGPFGDLHARAAVAGSKLKGAQLACGQARGCVPVVLAVTQQLPTEHGELACGGDDRDLRPAARSYS